MSRDAELCCFPGHQLYCLDSWDVLMSYSFTCFRHLPLSFAVGQIKRALGAQDESCFFFALNSMFITNSSLTFFLKFPYVLVDFRHKSSGLTFICMVLLHHNDFSFYDSHQSFRPDITVTVDWA